jgi:hypothetical protein
VLQHSRNRDFVRDTLLDEMSVGLDPGGDLSGAHLVVKGDVLTEDSLEVGLADTASVGLSRVDPGGLRGAGEERSALARSFVGEQLE